MEPKVVAAMLNLPWKSIVKRFNCNFSTGASQICDIYYGSYKNFELWVQRRDWHEKCYRCPLLIEDFQSFWHFDFDRQVEQILDGHNFQPLTCWVTVLKKALGLAILETSFLTILLLKNSKNEYPLSRAPPQKWSPSDTLRKPNSRRKIVRVPLSNWFRGQTWKKFGTSRWVGKDKRLLVDTGRTGVSWSKMS